MTIHHQQRQPVVGGTFGKGHGQHHDANQHQLNIAIEGQPFFAPAGLFAGIFSGAVRNGGYAKQDRRDTDQRSKKNVQICGHARGGECHAHPCARQGTETVKAVHHGQYRFAHLALDRRPFDVDGHFRRPKASAEDGKSQGKHQR